MKQGSPEEVGEGAFTGGRASWAPEGKMQRRSWHRAC